MRRATCFRDFARCGQRSVTADRQAVPNLAVSDGVVKSGSNLDEAGHGADCGQMTAHPDTTELAKSGRRSGPNLASHFPEARENEAAGAADATAWVRSAVLAVTGR